MLFALNYFLKPSIGFDFILSSKGYEITIKKGSKEARYTDKTPEKALIQAAKKAK